MAGDVEHQVLLLFAEQFPWSIFHHDSGVELAERAFFLELGLLQERLVLKVLHNELHADLLLRVAELIKEEAGFEAESLPAILREAVNLPLCIRHYEVIVQARVLGRRLHESVAFVEPADEAYEGQVPL